VLDEDRHNIFLWVERQEERDRIVKPSLQHFYAALLPHSYRDNMRVEPARNAV